MAGSTGPNIVQDGLILAIDPANKKSYPGSGTNFNDISGNGIIATLANSPTINSNGTITLDGINQYTEVVSDGTTKGFDTQNFTIDFWCNLTYDGAYEVLWSFDYTSHVSPYYAQHIRSDNSIARMSFYGNNGVNFVTNNNVINFGTWQNFTFIRDRTSNNGTIYIDGQFHKVTTGLGSDLTYYSQELWIGRSNFGTGYLKGTLGPYKFYNRVLSASEILQNYNQTKSRFT